MRDILKLSGILLLVTAIAGAALSMVNSITKPKIELQKRLALERALTKALPTANKDAIVHITDSELEYYKGFANPDTTELVGYAFVAEGKGYSSTIESMVGVDTLWTIIGLFIIHQVETPGLGTKIEEIKYGEDKPWFQTQFRGRTVQELVLGKKEDGDLEAITGATISSRTVTNSVKEGLKRLREHLEGFKEVSIE